LFELIPYDVLCVYFKNKLILAYKSSKILQKSKDIKQVAGVNKIDL